MTASERRALGAGARDAGHGSGHASETTDASAAATSFAVLAGAGSLPKELADTLAGTGVTVRIVALDGLADADFSAYECHRVGIGRLGGMIKALRLHGNRDMVIAGSAHRPDLSRIGIDFGFIRHLPTVLSLLGGGDDTVLRRVARFFERAGLRVHAIGEVAPEMLAAAGPIVGEVPEMVRADAQIGHNVIRDLGPFDVGQAVVISDGRVLAIEGLEGTDGMLLRLGAARRNGSLSPATLVKATKPQQDLRFDLPTIGPRTIERCGPASIMAIALEAGRSLIVSSDETRHAASKAGVAIFGLAEAGDTGAKSSATNNASSLVQLGSRRASQRASRDADIGVRMLNVLSRYDTGRAVVVRHAHVLAVAAEESASDLVARTQNVRPWGNRIWSRKSGMLVLGPNESIDSQLVDAVASAGLCGLAVSQQAAKSSKLGAALDVAQKAGLCVLGGK